MGDGRKKDYGLQISDLWFGKRKEGIRGAPEEPNIYRTIKRSHLEAPEAYGLVEERHKKRRRETRLRQKTASAFTGVTADRSSGKPEKGNSRRDTGKQETGNRRCWIE